jgi:hypothetical protein
MMKALLFSAVRTFVFCVMAATLAGTTLANPYHSVAQDKDKKAGQISGDEQKALSKVRQLPTSTPSCRLPAS